jgi:hypothetical protein
VELYPRTEIINEQVILASFLLRTREPSWQQADAGLAPLELESFERELHDHVMALERELLADDLARYDVSVDAVESDGTVYRRALKSRATYLSAAGPVAVERHRYRPPGRSTKSICPVELGAGIIGGLWTPRAARQGAFGLAHLTPRECAAWFGEFGALQPSASTLDRVAKVLNANWEADRPTWEAALRAPERGGEAAVTMAVSLDGVMTPMRKDSLCAAETRAEAKGPSKAKDSAKSKGKDYREAACGTLSLYNPEGERLSTVRYGRMPQRKKAVLCGELEAESQHLMAQRPDLQVVKLADGAEENWRFLEHLDLGLEASEASAVESGCIVDFYHAADHLSDACVAIWGEGSAQGQAEFVRLRTLLKEDDQGVDKIMRRLRYRASRARGKTREAIEEELVYFRNQRQRMRYAQYVREHVPIGSGVVEAACKTLVTRRLKGSGMRWSVSGGQAILTLRSIIQSGRWERAWALLRETFRTPVRVCPVDSDAVDNAA